jgi:hypothetical protein
MTGVWRVWQTVGNISDMTSLGVESAVSREFNAAAIGVRA